MPLNAHAEVQKIARNIAATLWENVWAHDNRLYRAMLAEYGTEKAARKVFIAQVAPKFYENARLALVDTLGPDSKLPDALKMQISEALIQDHACRGNRVVSQDLAVVPPEYLH